MIHFKYKQKYNADIRENFLIKNFFFSLIFWLYLEK